MKKKILYVLLSCFSILGTTVCYAQSNDNQLAKECAKESKMKYVHSMEEAQKMAYQKKKPIFFNCYAEWAGPCMAMDRFVFSDQEFADYMDKNFIMRSTVFLIAENTMITVDVQNVGITEIMRITVKKQIVSAGNCIGFDPVAGQNGVLHAIIAYK